MDHCDGCYRRGRDRGERRVEIPDGAAYAVGQGGGGAISIEYGSMDAGNSGRAVGEVPRGQ